MPDSLFVRDGIPLIKLYCHAISVNFLFYEMVKVISLFFRYFDLDTFRLLSSKLHKMYVSLTVIISIKKELAEVDK